MPAAFTPKELTQRGGKNYMVVARLKDGVTPQRAQSEINAITERIKQADPEEYEGFGALLIMERASPCEAQFDQFRGPRFSPLATVRLSATSSLIRACTAFVNSETSPSW